MILFGSSNSACFVFNCTRKGTSRRKKVKVQQIGQTCLPHLRVDIKCFDNQLSRFFLDFVKCRQVCFFQYLLQQQNQSWDKERNRPEDNWSYIWQSNPFQWDKQHKPADVWSLCGWDWGTCTESVRQPICWTSATFPPECLSGSSSPSCIPCHKLQNRVN